MTSAQASVTEPVRVYINETAVGVSPGSTVLDAVRSFSSEAATALESGRGHVTDGAGRPIALGESVSSGSIIRVIGTGTRNRQP